MQRVRIATRTASTVGMLLSLVYAHTSGYAAVIDQVVGAVAPDGGAELVKRFHLEAGAVVVGVEFLSNDLRTVFPSVALLQGDFEKTSEATVLRDLRDVPVVTKHRVHVTVPAIRLTEPQDLFVAVRLPASNGVRGIKDGAGLAATRLNEPNGSYLSSPPDGTLYPIDVDLAIELVLQTAGKAATNSGGEVAREAFLRAVGPNPASAAVRIEFGVVRPGTLKLSIYDVAGRRVRSLLNEAKPPGVYMAGWDGRDEQGQHVADGVYVVKLEAREASFTQKLVLVR